MTLAVGTVLLTPNIYWLTTHAFMPFSYAMDAHSGTPAFALFSALIFTSNGLAYAVAAIALCMLATRPSWAAIRDTLWPAEPQRRTLLIAFATPFLFAVLIAVVLTVAIESIWVMPAMTLLPVVLLASPLVAISRVAAVRLLALAVVFPLGMLAVSPLVALGVQWSGVPDYGSDYRAVAQAVERVWRAHTDKPLRIVGSTTFVNGIVFYFKDLPSTFDIDNPKLTPWVSDDRIRREGAAIVCPETEAFCMRALGGFAAHFPSSPMRTPWCRAASSASLRRSTATRSSSFPRPRRSVYTAHGAGTLTLHRPRVFIVASTSRASGEVGVL